MSTQLLPKPTTPQFKESEAAPRLIPTEPLPEDLSVLMEKRTLVGLVLNAVDDLNEAHLRPIAARNAGPAYQPRILLALLAYSYAVGNFASGDIERTLHEDVMFRFLCGNEYPTRALIRRFRRQNRDALVHCLQSICRHASQMRLPQAPQNNGTSQDWIATQVEDRIEKALWMDSAAFED